MYVLDHESQNAKQEANNRAKNEINGINRIRLLCIWHWIGKNRCKIGERVLKHATIWISIIKISN